MARWRASQFPPRPCYCLPFRPTGQPCWSRTRSGRRHSTGPLWAVPVLGGSPRRLGETVGQAAAWSPDGQMIVYADGHDLFLAKSDGTEPHKLVSAPDQAFDPAWSPDGTVIRFRVGGLAASTATGSLWQVSVDGTNLHPLLPGWHTPPSECCGKWTARRQIFCFPVTRQYLGACGKGELAWKSQRPTLPVDLRADDFLLACAQQGWQKAVRGGRTGARGAGSLRCEVRRVRSISFRNFGG